MSRREQQVRQYITQKEGRKNCEDRRRSLGDFRDKCGGVEVLDDQT